MLTFNITFVTKDVLMESLSYTICTRSTSNTYSDQVARPAKRESSF